jgi:hypothetical protein
MITGPETYLNRNVCGRKNPTTLIIAPMITFGPFIGAVSSGSSIELEVASGNDRVITLVGFYATDISACQDINLPGFDKSHLSKPFILGQSAKINLKPTTNDDSISVPVNMSFNTTGWFDSCSGPEWEKSNLLGKATQVVLRKTSFPQNATLENFCSPLNIELEDAYFRTAKSDFITNLKLTTLNSGALTYSDLNSYATYMDCYSQTGDNTYFSIPAGQSNAIRWVKTNSTLTSQTNSYRLSVSGSALLTDVLPTTINMPNSGLSAQKIDFTGPTFVNIPSNKIGGCYRYEISYRNFQSVFLTGNSNDKVSITVPLGVTVSSNTNCDGDITAPFVSGDKTYTISMPNGLAKINVYVNFPDAGIFKLSAKYTPGGTSFLSSTLPGQIAVAASLTSPTISSLAVRESLVLPTIPSTCFGPFHLNLVNTAGADVRAKSDPIYIAYSGPTGGASSVTFNNYCGGGQITGQVQIHNLDSNAEFFITTPAAPTPGTFPFSFTLDGIIYSGNVILN